VLYNNFSIKLLGHFDLKYCENPASQYIHAMALLKEEKIGELYPISEHQHAFVATIHYTMLIAA
jgi:hypothetical protein